MKKKYPDPIRRKDSGKYFFWYTGPDGKRRKVSTGFGRGQKEQARQFIRDYVDRKAGGLSQTFRQYSEPFFIIESCPKVARLKQEGRPMGESHIKKSRKWLENYVLSDLFADLPLNEIRRADVLDLRSRLLSDGNGENTVNKCIETVKSILSEASYRQDLAYNPAGEIGKLRYDQKERAKLTMEEIRDILSFSTGRIGWQVYEIEREIMNSPQDNYKAAYHAAIKLQLGISIPKAQAAQREALAGLMVMFLACTGCRVGEVRCIRWGSINMETGRAQIIEAFKTETLIGLPKWNKTREISLTAPLLDQLRQWKEITPYPGPDNFVFSQAEGRDIGVSWVKKNFDRIIKTADDNEKTDFKIAGRSITPHVMRHSLNTNLLASEVSPLLVQTFLGWSSQEQKILTKVQEGYTGLELFRLETVSEKIQEIYFPEYSEEKEAAQ